MSGYFSTDLGSSEWLNRARLLRKEAELAMGTFYFHQYTTHEFSTSWSSQLQNLQHEAREREKARCSRMGSVAKILKTHMGGYIPENTAVFGWLRGSHCSG